MDREEQGLDRMEEGGGGFMELMSSGGEDGGGFLFAQQMLCFGGKEEEEEPLHRLHGVLLAQKSRENSSVSSSLSSSPPPPPPSAIVTSSGSSKKAGRGGGRSRTARLMSNCSTAVKKPKTENSAAAAAAAAAHGGSTDIKERKEKLGDRIMALQKLVSPFGKSDTASVLHEALGYIRFLHDQVHVLSSPYLQGSPPGDHIRDLRSRGLCLVPLSCTEHVTGSNGADLWSPATAATGSGGGVKSSFSSSSISER